MSSSSEHGSVPKSGSEHVAEFKRIKVTGNAAESVMRGAKTRKRYMRGGAVADAAAGPSTHIPLPIRSPTPTPLLAPVAAPVPATVNLVPAVPAPIKQVGGAAAAAAEKQVKVVLAPSRKKQSKLILAPPKTTTATTMPLKTTKAKTMKMGRRIRMNVDGLTKKLNRAKTIKKESEKMAIEKMKIELVKSGLIKSESKAPEGILRQMYSDFQMLKQRAL